MTRAIDVIFSIAYAPLAFNQGVHNNPALGAVNASSTLLLDTEESQFLVHAEAIYFLAPLYIKH